MIDWIGIYRGVSECGSWDEIEKFLVKKGVEKSEVLRVVKSSLSHYGYGRDYRNSRNVSMGEMRRELSRLKKLVGEEKVKKV